MNPRLLCCFSPLLVTKSPESASKSIFFSSDKLPFFWCRFLSPGLSHIPNQSNFLMVTVTQWPVFNQLRIRSCTDFGIKDHFSEGPGSSIKDEPFFLRKCGNAEERSGEWL